MSFGDHVPMHGVKLEHGYACSCRLAYSCLDGVKPSKPSLMNRAGGGHAMIVNTRPIKSRKVPGIGLLARKICSQFSLPPNAVAVISLECNPRSGPALGRAAAQER